MGHIFHRSSSTSKFTTSTCLCVENLNMYEIKIHKIGNWSIWKKTHTHKKSWIAAFFSFCSSLYKCRQFLIQWSCISANVAGYLNYINFNTISYNTILFPLQCITTKTVSFSCTDNTFSSKASLYNLSLFVNAKLEYTQSFARSNQSLHFAAIRSILILSKAKPERKKINKGKKINVNSPILILLFLWLHIREGIPQWLFFLQFPHLK